jgi:DNA (cytosine-5)-methyltransferase 1
LCARQNDKLLPSFPIWDDVQTFDGHPWRGLVDVISGGFPCQDISAAGKGAGITGERSGMWKHMARIIGEVRPHYVFVENSPMLTLRGLGTVLGDLSEMGFNAEWGIISASDVGANHRRERIWIVAHSNSNIDFRQKSGSDGVSEKVSRRAGTQHSSTRQSSGTSNVLGGASLQGHEEINNVGNAESTRLTSCVEGSGKGKSWRASIGTAQWWEIEPPMDRVVDGMADRVDRLKAIGNGQVPLCAATAFRILSKEYHD